MDSFACGLIYKVTGMLDSTRNNWFEEQQDNFDPTADANSLFDGLSIDDDLLMEQILENMNTTPIGKVLKKIAAMPEVSRKKVLRVRQQLTQGRYDLNERLDMALEKVLDDLNV